MDKVIIYISYDSFEYVNFYHLICNGQKVIEYCPEENLDEVFNRIKDNTDGQELYIVKDVHSSPWDFNAGFTENGIVLKNVDNGTDEDIYEAINNALDINLSNKEDVEIIFAGKATFKQENIGAEETIRQVKEIFKHGGEEMTELARIVKEKYERMNKHEQL